MLNEIGSGCEPQSQATTQGQFTQFMHEQIQCISKLRRRLCRQRGCEISNDDAVRVWIERGYAAAFRRRFEQI